MDDIRHRFPGLADGWVRLDGPAGTLPVDTAIAAMDAYLRSPAPANVGGSFAASMATDALVDRTRAACGRLLGAEPEQVIFGANATTLLFQLTRALARTWAPGDRIVCHPARPRRQRAPLDAGRRRRRRRGRRSCPSTARDALDVAPLGDLCASGRVRWVALSGRVEPHRRGA